ncbi:holdfast anchoring protein HfaA [Maricaulis parjimensis]|uniref:holdfast anchoring protein HfaA n=1 Tax=Maricaulis parjimensis TaxID=144023 RepID=UPI00193A7C1E|nr:holdfast anchoring protein HfaA [Maricaulis parjimensis]
MTLRKLSITAGFTVAMSLAASAAQAQQVESTAGWEIPYGTSTTATSAQAWSGASASAGAAARSQNGNRVIIDGIIQTGVGVSTQTGLFGGGVGSGATAIGNQLNVNVTGQYNTVIVNSNQINNGDINASANANGNVSSDNDQD